MFNKKKEPAIYPFYDYAGMEKHFEEMAAKGWMLESTGKRSSVYTYRRAEPAKVRFAVMYWPAASVDDSYYSSEQLEFFDYCRQAGWQKVDAHAQLMVFYTTDPDAVPIETDPLLQVENVHDAIKSEYLFYQGLLIFACVLQLFMRYSRLRDDAVMFFSSGFELMLTLMWLVLLLDIVFDLAKYFIWHYRAIRVAREENRLLELGTNPTLKKIKNFLLWPFVLFALMYFTDLNLNFFVVVTVFTGVMVGLIFGFMWFIQRFHWEADTNFKARLVFTIVAVIAVNAGLKSFMDNTEISFVKEEKQPVEVIENFVDDLDWKKYDDEMPLYIEDLQTVENPQVYSREYNTDSTVFLTVHTGIQAPQPFDEENPMLRYEIIKPANKIVYNICLESMLTEFDKYNKNYGEKYKYVEIDSDVWQADKAYRLTGGMEKTPRYIITYPDKMIFILTEFELTSEQQSAMAEKLKDL